MVLAKTSLQQDVCSGDLKHCEKSREENSRRRKSMKKFKITRKAVFFHNECPDRGKQETAAHRGED